jgi:hypothetical protein
MTKKAYNRLIYLSTMFALKLLWWFILPNEAFNHRFNDYQP